MLFFIYVCFFKQKTAYEMRISDWSSDVCSSDLLGVVAVPRGTEDGSADLEGMGLPDPSPVVVGGRPPMGGEVDAEAFSYLFDDRVRLVLEGELGLEGLRDAPGERSEEHTSELQSLMRISYAVFCLKKNKQQH